MKAQSVLPRLWSYAKPDAGYLVLALLCAPLSASMTLLQPYLLKHVVDDYITPGKLDGLQSFAAIYLASVLVGYVLDGVYGMALALAGQRLIRRLRAAIFDRLMGLPSAFYDRRPAGELMTRATSDVESLGETITAGVIGIVIDVLLIVGVLVAMLWLDWRLTLVLLAVGPPLVAIIEVCRRQLRKSFDKMREGLAAMNAFLAERIAGMEVVQLNQHQKPTAARFDSLNRPYTDAAVKSNVFDALLFATVDGVGSVCVALMLWYGTSDWLQGAVTAGLLVAMLEYLQRLFQPLRELSNKVAIIQRAASALEKIFWLLGLEDRIPGGEHAPDQVSGRLQVTDLRFAYKEGPPEEDILKGVSFSVEPGQVVAVVGPTGCGKSTLARLLTRTYDGYRGEIRLDDVELREWTVPAVRKAIASVSQEIQIFPETAGFNVDLGNPEISEAQRAEAAALTHADKVVSRLPGGWEHLLRERGADLSVGEGQLVTFARTMAYDPAVVILDEATAAIDPVTERLVQEAIDRILERKTVIVVAHRLSTVQAADRILVMRAGRIVESGKHAELVALGGLYAEMVEAGLSEAV